MFNDVLLNGCWLLLLRTDQVVNGFVCLQTDAAGAGVAVFTEDIISAVKC